MSGTVAFVMLAPALEQARRRGVRIDDVLRGLGLPAEGDVDPEARVEHQAGVEAWEELARRARDPHFGMRAALELAPGALYVHEYMLRFSETLGVGFQRISRFARLLSTRGSYDVDVRGDEMCLVNHPPGIWARSTNEFVVSLGLVIARRASAVAIRPKRAEFMNGKPSDVTALEDALDCPLVFGARANTLVLPRSAYVLPLPAHDERLVDILERFAERWSASLSDEISLRDRVRLVLLRLLHQEGVTLEEVARGVGKSARSLQRELRNDGTSYQRLLDEVRHELAVRYLAEGKLPITSVAFLLGFSDLSAFHRSFRRWSGTSPSAFRANRATR